MLTYRIQELLNAYFDLNIYQRKKSKGQSEA